MRAFLISLAIALFAATPTFAISIDGSISDWLTAGLLHPDALDDNLAADGATDIVRYGWTVDSGMFYSVLVFDRPLADFNGQTTAGKSRKLFPGAYINVDNNVSTTLVEWNDDETATRDLPIQEAGTDILLEWGRFVPAATPEADYGLHLWGADGNIDIIIQALDMAYTAAGGTTNAVVEWGCPVDTIVDALPESLQSYDDASNWRVVLGANGNTRDIPPSNYGYDYAVPEPGTLTLTILGLLGAFAYAWRKR